MTYVIAQPCVDLKDKACIEECPVDCIYEGERSLYIHPDECVDCGACEPVCPVEAIYYEDDVPEQWTEYYKANVEFFDDLGSPGRRREDGRDRQGPPDHRGTAPARARRVSRRARRASSPTSPGTRSTPFKSDRAGASRTGSSTCPWARRSTRRPPWCVRRWRPRRTPPATRRRWGTPDLREAVAGWFARRRGVPDVDPDGVLPTIGSQGAGRLAADAARPRRGDVVVHPRGRLPHLRRRRPPGRRDPGGRRRPRGYGPDHGHAVRARLAELPGQPHRRGPRRRRTSPRSSPGPAPTASWWRRDECYAELGWATSPVPSILDPAGLRRQPRRAAGGVLAVQAVQPRRLPRGVRRGRPGAGAPAARGAQARRDDRARRRCRRPCSRRSATTSTSPSRSERYARAPGLAAGGVRAARGSAIDALRGRACTCGSTARRGLLGRPSPGWPSAGSWWRRARSTARRGPSTSGSR